MATTKKRKLNKMQSPENEFQALFGWSLTNLPLVCETRGRVIYLGEIMRIIYLCIGFISLALAVIGVVLPLLPTTPFLLLAIACFSKSSKRFEDWLYHTKLYQTYVADFRETKSIARERKKKIIVSIYILMGISIYFAPLLPVKIGLGALTIFITYYLFKVIPDKE